MFQSRHTLRRALPLVLLVVVLPVFLFAAAGGLGGKADQESLVMTERAVRRAAVQCYALEGSYPASLADLEERYGVSIDESRIFVDYQYIASNPMPDITVLPAAGQGDPVLE